MPELPSKGDPMLGKPVQFGLAKLLQLMTVAGLWCGAAIVRDNVVMGLAYSVAMVALTWTVVGRWAVRLSPRACRRVLAATATLLAAGGFCVTELVDDREYLPIARLWIWLMHLGIEQLPIPLGIVRGLSPSVVGNVLLLVLVYWLWLAVFSGWDWLSARQKQRRLAWSFSALLVMVALPILHSVASGCYAFQEHFDSNGFHHSWLHCVIHIAMLVAACWIVVLLQRHGRRSTDPPPNWLKLVTWGYLCYYAALLQVALFPITFYIR